MRDIQVAKYYYLATPVFLLIEWMFDSQIRVSMPDGYENMRHFYLVACFVLGGFVLKGEVSKALFGIFESAASILLLLLGVMLPVLVASGNPELAGSFDFGVPELINFLLVGGFLLYCFYANPLLNRQKYDT